MEPVSISLRPKIILIDRSIDHLIDIVVLFDVDALIGGCNFQLTDDGQQVSQNTTVNKWDQEVQTSPERAFSCSTAAQSTRSLPSINTVAGAGANCARLDEQIRRRQTDRPTDKQESSSSSSRRRLPGRYSAVGGI
ncbi:unnamed protein product [Soboliphyme baturini]|uniref:Uncharacterized protein n=1 Tax=Soboliphyme baturini TaxID=241478 RepID=A0A183IE33_9BILA|nr:unnamed protein product [Soboliphyme baturini]